MNQNYSVGEFIYDPQIYDGMNTNLDDLQFYRRWLPKQKEARILELCCGTGRLTIPIAKEGYHITGVDFTKSMLDQAKHKAEKESLSIEFIQADIRTLDLQDSYDLIFIPFNSIHHLYNSDDLFRVFNVVKRHLKKEGLFLMDCFNPDLNYIVDAEKDQQEIANYTTNDGRTILIKQSLNYESHTQINRIEWHYYVNGAFHSTQNLDMRLFYPKELDTYIRSSGFEIAHKFGSFEEEAFQSKSNKQIFVCQ